MTNKYLSGLQNNREITSQYYQKSIEKTEQQKFLEQLLTERKIKPKLIADIACGGGTLSFHLSSLYPLAQFYLTDLNEDGLDIAKGLCKGDKFHFTTDNIYNIDNLPKETFDLVLCWQTLSWLDQPEAALLQLFQLVKPGGRLYLSSLFNLNHEVDVFANVKDNTRNGDEQYCYNTYSRKTVEKWLEGLEQELWFHPFQPEIDFAYQGKGLGTYTVKSEIGRLQFSGGILLNWAVLEVFKKDSDI